MVINNSQPLTLGNTNTFSGVNWYGMMSGSVPVSTEGVTVDGSTYNIPTDTANHIKDTAKTGLDEDRIDEDRLDRAVKIIKRKIRLAKQ